MAHRCHHLPTRGNANSSLPKSPTATSGPDGQAQESQGAIRAKGNQSTSLPYSNLQASSSFFPHLPGTSSANRGTFQSTTTTTITTQDRSSPIAISQTQLTLQNTHQKHIHKPMKSNIPVARIADSIFYTTTFPSVASVKNSHTSRAPAPVGIWRMKCVQSSRDSVRGHADTSPWTGRETDANLNNS